MVFSLEVGEERECSSMVLIPESCGIFAVVVALRFGLVSREDECLMAV